MNDPLSIADAARESPQETALISDDQALSFADLAARVGRLRSRFGGGRALVAVRAASSVDTVVGLLALIESGAPFVPLHPRLTANEEAALVADAKPFAIHREADFADDPSLPIAPPAPPMSADATLAELYTSGTTGTPKAAVLTRRAIAAAVAASETNLGVAPHDRWLLALPLCHVGGLSIVLRCLAARKPIVLVPRFDADDVLRAIVRHRATQLSVVPTMLARLLEADRANVLAGLRFVLVGGAACPDALLDECAKRSILALTTYGLTETCSQLTSQRLRDPRAREPGSGQPLPGASLAIFRDDGSNADAGEIGAIHVEGPMLFSGYRDRGPRPSPFPTGDLGSVDDRGRLHVAARRSDLIVTGGENVYPAEIERIADAAPGIESSMAFGVPHERWGAVVAIAIVVAPGYSESAFAAYLETNLAPHRRPRLVAVVAALPTTSLGKLDRLGASRGHVDGLHTLRALPN